MTDDRFTIQSLSLKNFRRFETLELNNFNPHFNLIVGENGAGKSTVLVALAQVASSQNWYRTELLSDVVTKRDVRRVPIYDAGNPNFVRQAPSSIDFIFTYRDFKFHKQTVLLDANSQTTDNIMNACDISPFAISDGDKIALPIFAHYQPNRNWSDSPTDADMFFDSVLKRSRASGYIKWFSAGSDAKFWVEWVKDQYGVALQRRNRTRTGGASTGDADFVDLFWQALRICYKDATRLEFDFPTSEILIHFGKDAPVEFSSLSDGQRTLIAMVADIARRCCLLNPHLGADAVKGTPGVVLIDELDLHLHPKWQRSIVANLKEAFPKIQFFATTHSPQIIGEVHPNELIVLGERGAVPQSESYGLDSNQVLEWIMNAPSREPEVQKDIDKLFEEIENHDFATASLSVSALQSKIGLTPEVVEARALIKRFGAARGEAAE